MTPEQSAVQQELDYMRHIVQAIDEAGKTKRQQSHTRHVEHLPEVSALRELLDVKCVGLQARLQRLVIIGNRTLG